MVGDPKKESERLRRALRRLAPPRPPANLRSYLGSPLPVLGLPIPAIRRIVEQTLRSWGRAPPRDLERILRALWAGPTYEERALAIMILDRYATLEPKVGWRIAEQWIDGATGWALSDALASGPVSQLVAAEPRRFLEVVRWSESPDLWRRRAATYALHELVKAGDLTRALRLLKGLVDDPEFWVQRAVGTWLRECWKKDPLRTERFLRRHARRLAPVTVTVATERASGRLRSELRGVRAAARATAPRPPS